MKKTYNGDKYHTVKLSKNGKSTRIGVHILVAKAFIPNDNLLKCEVNHKDFNRINNNYINLEWVTHKENVHYSIRAKRHICTTNLCGKNNPNYGNHKLHNYYLNNPDVAKEKFSRNGSNNGRSKPIILIDKKGIEKEFTYIGECCEYLIKKETMNIKIDSLRNRIREK